jgi:hypothetical protein
MRHRERIEHNGIMRRSGHNNHNGRNEHTNHNEESLSCGGNQFAVNERSLL